MNISFANINFTGVKSVNKIQNKTVSNPVMGLTRDVFEKTTPSNFTAENQEKILKAGFDDNSKQFLIRSDWNIDKIIELGSSIKTDKTKILQCKPNDFDNNETVVITAKSGEKEGTSITVDRNGKILSKETSKVTSYSTPKITDNYTAAAFVEIKSEDYRNNLTSEIVADWDSKTGFNVVLSEVKTKKDKQGRLVRKEISELSPVANFYNIKYEFPNGKTRTLAKATYDEKTGVTTIKKDMRSADMTRTQYLYQDDKNGNRIVDYKITDINGKVLMNQKQTFEKIDDNNFVSTRNGKTYDISIDKKALNISERNTDKKASLEIENKIFGQEKDSIVNMLKTISGDELMNFANKVDSVEAVYNDFQSKCSTDMDMFSDDGLTSSRLTVSDNPAVFLHELGHAIDSSKRPSSLGQDFRLEIKDELSSDKDFKKIYESEKKNFLKEYPEAQRNHIDYFIANEAVKGQKDRGRKETIAETNAILNTYKANYALAMRAQYLQQHFPKTIAYLSEKLTNA